MRNIVIFGAGRNGRKLSKIFPSNMIVAYIDNDPTKQGESINGVPVVPYNYLKSLKEDIDLILSTNSDEIRNMLFIDDIPYWEITGNDRNFLLRKEIVQLRDKELLDRYLFDTEVKDALGFIGLDSLKFRDTYYSSFNEALTLSMKNNMDIQLEEQLERYYSDEKKHGGEMYDNRFGLRLIRNLINRKHKKYKVCDLACGYGELLLELKKDGHDVYGIDSSAYRAQYCNAKGIQCIYGKAEDMPFEDKQFDAVVCTELLEHVKEPEKIISAIYRILKPDGYIYCSVPYGMRCDCDTHVRLFTENSLYTLLSKNGFEIENIIRIPCINENLTDDHILAGGYIHNR